MRLDGYLPRKLNLTTKPSSTSEISIDFTSWLNAPAPMSLLMKVIDVLA